MAAAGRLPVITRPIVSGRESLVQGDYRCRMTIIYYRARPLLGVEVLDWHYLRKLSRVGVWGIFVFVLTSPIS